MIVKKIVRFLRNCSVQKKKTELNTINGLNNFIENNGTFKNVSIDINGNNNTICVNKNSYLHDTKIIIQGNNHRLSIGSDCIFKGQLWFEDEFCLIEIGNNTTVEDAHIAVTEPNRKIIIGSDCMLSNEIQIRTGDSHSIIDNNTGLRINTAGDVEIGHHVWVGTRAIILKGVTVGNNAIIGGAAVVTKKIDPYSVVAGNPATLIKSGVTWIRERI